MSEFFNGTKTKVFVPLILHLFRTEQNAIYARTIFNEQNHMGKKIEVA